MSLGRCASDLGRPDEAHDLSAEALRIFTEIGNAGGQAMASEGRAGLPAR